jgi:hypothetical protein
VTGALTIDFQESDSLPEVSASQVAVACQTAE